MGGWCYLDHPYRIFTDRGWLFQPVALKSLESLRCITILFSGCSYLFFLLQRSARQDVVYSGRWGQSPQSDWLQSPSGKQVWNDCSHQERQAGMFPATLSLLLAIELKTRTKVVYIFVCHLTNSSDLCTLLDQTVVLCAQTNAAITPLSICCSFILQELLSGLGPRLRHWPSNLHTASAKLY